MSFSPLIRLPPCLYFLIFSLAVAVIQHIYGRASFQVARKQNWPCLRQSQALGEPVACMCQLWSDSAPGEPRLFLERRGSACRQTNASQGEVARKWNTLQFPSLSDGGVIFIFIGRSVLTSPDLTHGNPTGLVKMLALVLQTSRGVFHLLVEAAS